MGQKILDRYHSDAPDQDYIHFQGVNREQELGLVQCGHMATLPGYGYGPMIRDHHLIHFVLSGKGRLHLHGRVFPVMAGQCFVIHPHQIAYYESDRNDPWEYYWIGLCGFEAEPLLGQAGLRHDRFILPLIDAENLFQTLAAMVRAIPEKDNYLHLNGLLRVAVHYLIRNQESIGADFAVESVEDHQSTGSSHMDDEYVRIITSIIQTSYTEDISVERIASRLGLNRSYLTSVFRKHTGASIRSFLTRYRIERSCVLLRDDHRSVASVAGEVGFVDPLYFSRVFTRVKGRPPREYRRAPD